MRPEKRGSLLVTAATLFFSLEAIFTKYAYAAGVNVSTALTVRFIMASAVMVIVTSFSGQGFYIPRQELRFFSLMTFLYLGISVALYMAYALLPASLAIMFFFLYPAFTAVLSYFINGERLSATKIAALLLSFLGLTLLLGTSLRQVGWVGMACALTAAVLNGFSLSFYPKMLSRINQLTFVTWTFLFSAACFGLFGLASGGLDFDFAGKGWLALTGLSLLSTACSTLALVYGIRLVGSTLTAIISTLEPPVTVLLAVLLFGERLQGWQIAGACLVLLAILIPQFRLSPGQGKADH